MTKPKTSIEIAAQIALLDDHIAVSEETAERLAYDAVAVGNSEAAKEISKLSTEIKRSKLERETLVTARDVARQIEAETAAKANVAAIAAALSEDRSAAQRLVEKAERADAIVIELTDTLSEIAALEVIVHQHLRAAHVEPPGAIIGRRNIGGAVIERLSAIVRGDRARQDAMKTAAETSRIGWGFLINSEKKEKDFA